MGKITSESIPVPSEIADLGADLLAGMIEGAAPFSAAEQVYQAMEAARLNRLSPEMRKIALRSHSKLVSRPRSRAAPKSRRSANGPGNV